VFRNRLLWTASAVVTSMLAVMLLSVGGAIAKTPGWGFVDGFTGLNVTKSAPFTTSPAAVSADKYVAFDVSIVNSGKSNISSVILKTDIPHDNPTGNLAFAFAPTWDKQDPGATSCNAGADAPLSCDLGALNAGASVTIELVLKAGSSSLSFNFTADGNGNTPSDSGGTSHGDSLLGPAKITVSGNADYAGGFVLDSTDTFSTDDGLSKRNPQSSTAGTHDTGIAVTLSEGSSYPGGTDPICNDHHTTCIGQWLDLHVGNSDAHPIKVVLLIYGKGLPGSLTADDINVWHDGDGLIGDDPGERCSSATASSEAPCIWVEPAGQNWLVILYLTHNGGIRGTF
jgi:hypothetical protein